MSGYRRTAAASRPSATVCYLLVSLMNTSDLLARACVCNSSSNGSKGGESIQWIFMIVFVSGPRRPTVCFCFHSKSTTRKFSLSLSILILLTLLLFYFLKNEETWFFRFSLIQSVSLFSLRSRKSLTTNLNRLFRVKKLRNHSVKCKQVAVDDAPELIFFFLFLHCS